MAVSLAEGKARARAFLSAGEPAAALATLDHLLAEQPLDDDLRLEIAELLARHGKTAEAADIYRALSGHLLRAGRPLPALVAAVALGALGQPSDSLVEALADMYAAGSPRLAPFTARAAPVASTSPIPDLPDDLGGALASESETARAEAFDALAATATRRALDLSGHPPYQEQVHPVAFLSELAAEPLRAVLESLHVRSFSQGQPVVRQGDAGTSLFLVALGALQVTTRLPGGSDRELARLYENSLFGEMALVTSSPRTASVIALDSSTVLELDRAAIDRVRARLPAVEIALARFTRERLIRNLLTTSPLFTPFTREQQTQLLQRFEGQEIEAGTTVIRQGETGQGLFVVLTGTLQVVAHGAPGEDPVPLGQLHPGDIFGEMSLLTDQPTSAAVRADVPCTLLFLPRVYFDRLTEAIPEVKGYFARVAEQRAADNSTRLSVAAFPEINVDLGDGVLF